ncbi:MAG: DUF881 domain-containing protein [Coriobacteriia bacterium]|nr:DUF881 domain-containing protein [Coriobacteriia bacterium]
MSPGIKPRQTLLQLRDKSVRRLVESERAVERSFHEGRLLASLAVGLLLVGFLLVAQWRGNQSFTREIERQSDQDLAIIIQEITGVNVGLRDEVMRLEVRILDAERETKDTSELLNEAAEELDALKLMTGLDPAVGPGVLVRIEDPEHVLLAQDFVALVHELRAGGAEAISVNGRRVTATSGFSEADGHVVLDGMRLTGGYVVEAIGDAGSLEQALTMPGGLESRFASFPGVTTEVERDGSVSVGAALERRMTYGRPVEGD